MTTPIDIVVGPTGITVPSYADVLAYLTAQYQSIYGSDVVLTPDTQDGQWLGVLSQALYDYSQSALDVFNAYSPISAQGAGLSSVVKINGLQRDIPTQSTVTLNLVGQAGATINNGIVGDNLGLGTQWALPASVTLSSGGTATVTATCTVAGAVGAAIASLTVILTPTQGWQTVSNPAIATVGAPTETDAALRQRQTQSTSLSALTPLEAIYAAVSNVPGVGATAIYENDTGSTDGNGNIAHSIAVVVTGGNSAAVAGAIAETKSPGTATNGSTSVVVIDTNGVPDTINFFYVTTVPVFVTVTLTPLAGYVSTTTTLIQQVVAALLNGLTIGTDSYLSRLYNAANLSGDVATATSGLTQAQLDVLSATYNVTAIIQGTSSGGQSAADIAIAFNATATGVVTNVTVNT